MDLIIPCCAFSMVSPQPHQVRMLWLHWCIAELMEKKHKLFKIKKKMKHGDTKESIFS